MEGKQMTPQTDQIVRAQAHVLGLLNEVQAVLEGWVLGHDREEVEPHVHALMALCDTDSPPSVQRREANHASL